MWTPPAGSTLSLHLSIPGVSTYSDEGRAVIRKLREALGVSSAKGESSIELSLNSPRLPKIIERLPAALKTHKAALKWWLSEPIPPLPAKGGWFDVAMGGAEADNAIKLRKDVHYGYIRLGEDCRYSYAYVASDRFLAAVREHKLKGLESLPLPPAGKKPQAGWWQVFAPLPTGRGLDHPASDSAGVEAEYASDRHFKGARRFGVSEPRGKSLSADRIDHPLLRELLSLGEGAIRGPGLYVREHLPDADFAYEGWGTSDGHKGPHRKRGILFSRRARDVMVDAGLIKESRFDPVLIIPAAEARNPVLDRTIGEPLPLPTYTTAELAVERARREALVCPVVAKSSSGKAIRLKSIAQARKELVRAAKAANVPMLGEDSALLRTFEKSALRTKLPTAWNEIASSVPVRLADLDDDRAEIWLLQTPTPPDFAAHPEFNARPRSERLSRQDIVIGATAFGDWYAIRSTDPAMPEDAAVRLWSHETLSISQEWDSVLRFAEYLVETAMSIKA